MEWISFWLPFAFFAIALLYAMAGFGGGSSYLAVLALIGVPHTVIPQVALVCNIIVSGGGVWHFRRSGHLALEKIVPFIAASIPMAYLGGRIAVGREVFVILLAVSLFAAGARTLMPNPDSRGLRHVSTGAAWRIGLPLGAVLGFLAGVVGIGGGIFLSPTLILIRWADARGAAAAASVFVLVNSLSGLAGQFAKGIHVDGMLIPLAVAVLLGGQIGSRLGAYRLPVTRLRHLLGLLVVVVSIRLIWEIV